MKDPRDISIAAACVRARTPGVADREWIDDVAVEAPLEVRINGRAATVLLRTPGADVELIAGFLFGEGIIQSVEQIVAIAPPADLREPVRGNVLDVQLDCSNELIMLDRPFISNSSCGACGKRTIDSLAIRATPSLSNLRVSATVLNALPEKLRAAQSTFARTGGVHAAGLFTAAGELVALREDLGRHNALDKLVGWALANGHVPLADYVLVVSGRVSYEIVQKAACAGLPFVAAVGAPSSLAIELSQRFNLTLVGFLKPASLNIYANGDRIIE